MNTLCLCEQNPRTQNLIRVVLKWSLLDGHRKREVDYQYVPRFVNGSETVAQNVLSVNSVVIVFDIFWEMAFR